MVDLTSFAAGPELVKKDQSGGKCSVIVREQGNAFEASAVKGVENAKDPDVSEVTTHQVPEDDVPEEYLNAD
jgi:hypothetical protein